MKTKSLILILSLILSSSLFAQTDNLFWFAAPDLSSVHGSPLANGAPIMLHITSEDETVVTISQPANSSFTPITIQMGEKQLRSIRLDTSLDIAAIENFPQALPVPPGSIQKKAFKITSEPGNISVYYEPDNNYNRETFTLKGRNALGKEFYVSTQNYFPNGAFSSSAWSGFVIAATENNSRIVVYPNDDWYLFDTNPGDSIVLTLNAGETFAFRAASTAPERHINGVRVKADKDIVITYYDDSIRKKNTESANCGTGLSYDLIGDQLVPVEFIGTEYIVVKGDLKNIAEPNCPADGGERIFITSTEANTDISINGSVVATLATAGQMFNYPVETTVLHVIASKPVYLTHITGFGGETGSSLIPSVDKSTGSKNVVFSRSPNVGDAFQLNLAIRNVTDFFNIQSIDAFNLYYSDGWTSIPNNFFEYVLDSTWLVLKKTPEVTAFFNNQITPGTTAVIENYVTGFQLGAVSGSSTTGAKYGYFSGFDPVKQIMKSTDSLKVTISTNIFDGVWADNEWIALRITDTVTNEIWYDKFAGVPQIGGFRDTVYLDSGTYKCEIVDMGANVSMPVITVDDDHIIQWGYPDYEYYLFTVPGTYNTENTIWLSSCDSATSPSRKYTWFDDGVYVDTIPNAEGFDSLLTVNLNIKHSSSTILNDTACFSYVSPSGLLLENSGIYHQVISNSEGCDNNITINLTVIKIDNTVETIANTMKASEENASYQWLACTSALDIAGATEQMYSPVTSGLYAVRITKDGCTTTSNCTTITMTGATVEANNLVIDYYPNPLTDGLYIDLHKLYGNIEVNISDMSGRTVLSKQYSGKDKIYINAKDLSRGTYFIRLTADGHTTSFKIIR